MIAAIMALLVSLPAPQAADDWDLTQSRGAVTASIAFSEGVLVVSRCRNGTLDVLIGGLPPVTGGGRSLNIAVGDGDEIAEGFTVAGQPTAAFSRVPVRLARRLRDGGRLVIRTESTETAPAWNFVAELPASSAAVGQTLSSCGRPAVDPRLAQYGIAPGAPDQEDVRWRVQPRPSFPGSAFRAGIKRGEVVTSCAALPDGRPQDCVVESAIPAGEGFEREALLSMRRARFEPYVRAGDAQAVLVTFTLRWRTD